MYMFSKPIDIKERLCDIAELYEFENERATILVRTVISLNKCDWFPSGKKICETTKIFCSFCHQNKCIRVFGDGGLGFFVCIVYSGIQWNLYNDAFLSPLPVKTYLSSLETSQQSTLACSF